MSYILGGVIVWHLSYSLKKSADSAKEQGWWASAGWRTELGWACEGPVQAGMRWVETARCGMVNGLWNLCG